MTHAEVHQGDNRDDITLSKMIFGTNFINVRPFLLHGIHWISSPMKGNVERSNGFTPLAG